MAVHVGTAILNGRFGGIAKALVPDSKPSLNVLLIRDGYQSDFDLQRAVAELPGARVTVISPHDLAHRPNGGLTVDLVLVDADSSPARMARTIAHVRERVPGAPILFRGGRGAHPADFAQQRQTPDLFDEPRPKDGLAQAVRYAVRRNRLELDLPQMALTDDLTGLLNRRGIFLLGNHQLRVNKRLGRRLLVCFLDVDGLKQINDRWGHAEGDRALVRAAEVLRTTFRGSDLIGRIGGDEFVVLALEDQAPDAAAIRERLERVLQEANEAGPRRYELSLSMGTAQIGPVGRLTLEEVLARADAGLYARKRRKYASDASREPVAATFATSLRL